MSARTSYKNDPIFWWGYSRPRLQLRLDYESTASLLERQFSDIQTANNKVSQMEKVWMIVVKMTWKNMNIAHDQDHYNI